MPTECYLKNLDVEFISSLAKDKIDTKTKGLVQYMTIDHFFRAGLFNMSPWIPFLNDRRFLSFESHV